VTRLLTGLTLFGVSFGCVEAAVVVYLRGLYEPIHQRVYPGRQPGDLFPILLPAHLETGHPEGLRWMRIELVREAATILMLAAVAVAAARNFRQWFAAFMILFGIWDIFFYVFLKLFIVWPESLWTWDLLFLLPVPWAGPVLAPVLVSALMIAAGVLIFRYDLTGRPLRISAPRWALIVSGGLIVVMAFCWDFRNIAAGGEPNAFPWPLFALGEAVGLAALLSAVPFRRGART
jgi:hypothetical protein